MMSDFSGTVSVLGAIIGGFVSFFSPCIFPLLPVYLGYLSGNQSISSESNEDSMAGQASKRILQINVLFFVAGISTVFFFLGFFSGNIGIWLFDYLPIILKISGLSVMFFGLIQLGIVRVSLFEQERRLPFKKRKKGYPGAYVLGMAFSFGWTPCIGPILTSILLLASTQGNAMYSGGLLIFYSLGFGIPFLLISFFTSTFLQYYRNFYPYLEKVKMAGGVLLIIMAALLFTDNLNIFLRVWP